jgi:hypothetical protein
MEELNKKNFSVLRARNWEFDISSIVRIIFGENYFDRKKDNSLIIYQNFRNFDEEVKYGWDSANNEKIHDSLGSKFKIFIGSSEIIHFATFREFDEFIWVLQQSLNKSCKLLDSEKEQLNQYLKKINCSFEELTNCFNLLIKNERSQICSLVTKKLGIKYTLYILSNYLSFLQASLYEINEAPYQFISKNTLNYFSMDLSEFFTSRFDLLYFIFKIIPSYKISSILKDRIYNTEEDGEQGNKIIGYNTQFYFLFYQNFEIFINGVLNLPNKWKKKAFPSIFTRILNFILIISIKIKFYSISFYKNFSNYNF